MITSKQRALLRGMANPIETTVQIGKLGIGETLVKQVDDTLLKRELVKLRVLETSPVTSREAAAALAKDCGAEIVQVIGTRFVLYRPNPEKPVIVL